MVDGNKLSILKSIQDWMQTIKQKSIDLHKLFILEYTEEIEKGNLSECDSIAYRLFELCTILGDITEKCKIVEYYLNKK